MTNIGLQPPCCCLLFASCRPQTYKRQSCDAFYPMKFQYFIPSQNTNGIKLMEFGSLLKVLKP